MILGGPTVIAGVLAAERQEAHVGEETKDGSRGQRGECPHCWLQGWREGHKPRRAGSL